MKEKSLHRLTKNALQVIQSAQQFTKRESLREIPATALIHVLLQQPSGLGKTILKSLNFSLENLAQTKNFQSSVSLHEILVRAFGIALTMKSPYVGTEHLIQGLLSFDEYKKFVEQNKKKSQSKNDLPFSFTDKNISSQDQNFFQEMSMLIDNFFSPANQERKQDLRLQSFATNLTDQLKKKDYILVGRQKELTRLANILGRRMKNNPVLIGEPGVGKTAIVEGLAKMITQGKAPYYLANKKILQLDLGLLVAGTTFRGEFEGRLKEILHEAKNDAGIILFIDEIHNLVGAGNAVGGMDAANLLKPALSRGEIQLIGATTQEEYRKYIEKDAALERRFQPIFVEEPTVEETVKILEGIRPLYENYHNLKIESQALAVSAQLAKRYFAERFLPDSAIDLIDETASKIRSRALNNDLYDKAHSLRQKIEEIAEKKERLIISDEYEEALILRNEERKLTDQLVKIKKQQSVYESKNPIYLKNQDILETVSEIMGLPLSLLSNDNKDIAKRIKSELQKNLVGQNHALEKIYETLLRQLSGIANPHRPLGSFLFVGQSGMGKSYTAKLLSEAITPNQKSSLIQLNMSEFMERHTVSRLLGAPAGYIGYEEGGELAGKIKRNPYSVVLFDEIEKAEPSVLNLLLQILEEGQATDAKGKVINFKNTIIILTTNIGAGELKQLQEIGFKEKSHRIAEEKNKAKKIIMEEIENELAPELLNRIDEIVIFENLEEKNYAMIAKNELHRLTNLLKKRDLNLLIDKSVLAFLAKKASASDEGARFIRKEIQRHIETLLAEKILTAKMPLNIKLIAKNERILIEK